MQKVVRRVINHKYSAMRPNILVEGTVIDFDCYIKRFYDYVIIIESGTLITMELAYKVKQNDQIYILLHDIAKVNNYKKKHELEVNNGIAANGRRSVEELISEVKKLSEKLDDISNFEKKLGIVYQTTEKLMEAVFYDMSETLPLHALSVCVEMIVDCLDSEDMNIMPAVLHLISNEYTTHHHSVNVAIFSTVLGKSIALKKEELIDLAYAALLHDIGKIRIEQEILDKPASLEVQEYERIQRHSDFSYEIMQTAGIENQKILDGIRYHHEKLDGTGYPLGLRGKRIPKFARIIGMCDVFDALTTRRTFRANYTSYEALMLMKQQMADQFDEYYTDTFIRLLGSSQKKL